MERLHSDGIWNSSLGDLEDDLRGVIDQPGLRCDIFHAAAAENLRGHVETDLGVAVVPQPVAQLGCHLVYHPVGYEPGRGRVLNGRDELGGRDNDAGGSTPANEGFPSHAATVLEGDGGQVFEKELSLRQGLSYCSEVDHFGARSLIGVARYLEVSDSLDGRYKATACSPMISGTGMGTMNLPPRLRYSCCCCTISS